MIGNKVEPRCEDLNKQHMSGRVSTILVEDLINNIVCDVAEKLPEGRRNLRIKKEKLQPREVCYKCRRGQ